MSGVLIISMEEPPVVEAGSNWVMQSLTQPMETGEQTVLAKEQPICLGVQTVEQDKHPVETEEQHVEIQQQPVSEQLPVTVEEAVDCSSDSASQTEIILELTAVPLEFGAPGEEELNPLEDTQEKRPVDDLATVEKKNIPPKKDRLDPLKIDMSRPPPCLMPLTSSQISLQCLECHIIFSEHKSKERHLKQKHPAEYEQCMLGDALFTCYVCDRHFTNSSDLMLHQRAHTEKQPFKCPICGEAFKRSSELTLHKKNHFGQDGYACTDCGKPCKTLSLLKYHRRTHTGERPYVCKECGKRYSVSVALRRHLLTHSLEGEAGEVTPIMKTQLKKKNCATAVKYPCSICKATFKTVKTRLYHMKRKHSPCVTATSSTATSLTGKQVRPGQPIITSAPMGQPTYLHMDHGPLQQVDNIDTEQIRKLIESLGNVQRVNQVVILGQVPPDGEPLDLLQLQGIGEPMQLRFNQPQPRDLRQAEGVENMSIGLEQAKPQCDSLEQIITLEPVISNEQMETSLVSHTQETTNTVSTEHTRLTAEENQTHREMIHQELLGQTVQTTEVKNTLTHSEKMFGQTETVDLSQTSEQTVVLELTPSLIPNLELEHTQTDTQGHASPPSLSTIEFEKNTEQNERIHGGNEDVQLLKPTVELAQTPLQTDQQEELSDTLLASTLRPPQTPSAQLQMSQVEETVSQIETGQFDQIQCNNDGQTEPVGVQGPVKKPHVEDREYDKQCVLQMSCLGMELSTQVEGKTFNAEFASTNVHSNHVQAHTQTSQTFPPPSETKHLPQSSQLPVHLMSVQEFVKVRKRKQSGNTTMQGNMPKTKIELKEKPTKQPKAKKARLVVKFNPKEKFKKQKKTPQTSKLPQKEDQFQEMDQMSFTTLPVKKVPLKQKAVKEKKVKKPNSISKSKIKSPSVQQDLQVQQVNQAKKKPKKLKDVSSETHSEQIIEPKLIAPPKPKKKKKQKIPQEDQPKNIKDQKLSKSARKKKKQNMKPNLVSEDMENPQIKQQSLLLLKGHKQPQLKVYKLDASTAPQGQTEEVSPSQCQTDFQQDQDTAPIPMNKRTKGKQLKMLAAGGKRKVGRPKKNQTTLSILAPLKSAGLSSDTLPIKPKTNRKRKAPNVETEGIISGSHSYRALKCKDCEESFSDVSSLQEHKVALHAVESPGLTYTNGNIFEGISRSDLSQPPLNVTEEVIDYSLGQKNFEMHVASHWDSEVDMRETGLRERGEQVSFPALNPSPSRPQSDALVEGDEQQDRRKSTDKPAEDIESSSVMALNSTLSDFPTQVKFPYLSKSVQTLLSDRYSSTQLDPIAPLHTSTTARDTKIESPDNINETSDALLSNVPGSDHLAPIEDEIKEELLLEVDLVTVGEGEQNIGENNNSPHKESSQIDKNNLQELNRIPAILALAHIEDVNKIEKETNESCSFELPEIKQEDEEILVQKGDDEKRGMGRKIATKSRRRGVGQVKKVFPTKSLRECMQEIEPEKETEECQVVYQLYSLTNNTEIKDEDFSNIHPDQSSVLSLPSEIRSSSEQHVGTVPDPSAPCIPTQDESSEDQVVFELESVTTSVVEVLKTEDGMVMESEAGDQDDRDNGQSPGIILERFLTSRQREAADGMENGVVLVADLEGQNVNTSDLVSVPHTSHPPHKVQQRGVRMYLVKQENSLVLNDPQVSQGLVQIKLNVEQRNARQCIFYPVKEEGTSQSERDMSTLVVPVEDKLNHPDDTLSMTDNAVEDCGVKQQRAEQLGIEIKCGEGEQDIEQQETEELVDFLLQSSDDESEVPECSDPLPDPEAMVLSCYQDSQNPTSSHSNDLPNHLRTREMKAHSGSMGGSQAGSGYTKPIDYFSKYFGWETWVEIAQCTNKVSHLSNPLTAKEVAQFVGIHIAMGTLKFPSLKLYWQDFTRVPLVADTMTASRFSQISCKLKLASPLPAGDFMDTQEVGRHGNTDTSKQGDDECNPNRAYLARGTIRPELDGSSPTLESSHSQTQACSSMSVQSTSQKSTILHSNEQNVGHMQSSQDTSSLRTDPLWRVRSLLDRVRDGCLLLRREGDHGIDQYPLHLTRNPVNNTQPSLHSTVLVGSDGLILDFNLSLDLSNKEAVVEKMLPRKGMVYLCKQELSTPTMLERLLEAGVHGAGQVGGARGQIGDEFVSSDGRLMLRRFELGFILSTVGTAQQNMESLIDGFEKTQKAVSLNTDLRNLYCSPLSASATTSWPQAILWYLTDMALVNSWLEYRQEHSPVPELLNLMGFRLEVSKALILSSGSDTQDSAPPRPPSQKLQTPGIAPDPGVLQESSLPDTATRYDGSGHWPEQFEEGEGGKCRFGGCDRMSQVRCLKCCVFLCISRNHNCFLNFHSQARF
ncbi:hypothetical protein UPYG_G00152030 [Umbra pygmaea]|uniref:C2H2-type domain-containing protein n=1 Tax=Umbra pygmaea TaxID=75934 RepID=A0ABD0XJT2_UMBPY